MHLTTPARFLVVGIANTAVGLAVICGVKAFGNLGDIAANILGYFVGLLLSFALNRQWTFADVGAIPGTLARFLFSFLIAYAINLLVVLVLIDSNSLNPYAAHAIGVIPYTVVFYFMSRYVVFRKPLERQDHAS